MERIFGGLIHFGLFILSLYLFYQWGKVESYSLNSIISYEVVGIVLLILNLIATALFVFFKGFRKIKIAGFIISFLSFIFIHGFYFHNLWEMTPILVLVFLYPILVFTVKLPSYTIFPIIAGALYVLAVILLSGNISKTWPELGAQELPLLMNQITVSLIAVVVISFIYFAILMKISIASIEKKYLVHLNNLLPEHAAKRLLDGETMFANHHENIAVLFADLADFTALTKHMPSEALVTLIHELFSNFDEACSRFKCDKIKTVGDGYLVVSGLQGGSAKDSTLWLLKLAVSFNEIIRKFNEIYQSSISLRIGINTGPAIVGILGKVRTSYDLWGRTVNFASRLESSAENGTAMLSEYSYSLVASHLGKVDSVQLELKGLGKVTAFQISLG